jgi:hypothetical protein
MCISQKVSKLLIGSLVVVLGGLFITSASAQAYTISNYTEPSENRVVISPASMQVNLQSGEETVQQMTVVNRLGRTVTFKIGAEFDTKPAPEGWVKPEMESIRLKQGDRVTFDIRIKAAAGVNNGTHRAVVFAGTVNEGTDSNPGITLATRIGMSINVHVSGAKLSEGTSISSLETVAAATPVDTQAWWEKFWMF